MLSVLRTWCPGRSHSTLASILLTDINTKVKLVIQAVHSSVYKTVLLVKLQLSPLKMTCSWESKGTHPPNTTTVPGSNLNGGYEAHCLVPNKLPANERPGLTRLPGPKTERCCVFPCFRRQTFHECKHLRVALGIQMPHEVWCFGFVLGGHPS